MIDYVYQIFNLNLILLAKLDHKCDAMNAILKMEKWDAGVDY